MIAHGLLYRLRRWLCHAGLTSVTSLDRYRAIQPISGEQQNMKYVIKVGSLYVSGTSTGTYGADTLTLTASQKDANKFQNNSADDMTDLEHKAGGRFVKLRPKVRR